MQQQLAPILFQDDDPAAGRALRPSPVAPASRSPSALAKITTKVTADGTPVHSVRSLLADLGTICATASNPPRTSPPSP